MPNRLLSRRDLLLGACAFAAAPAWGQAALARYFVEVIVFRQPGALPAAPAAPTPAAVAAPLPGRIELLPAADWQLGAFEARLRRQGAYRVLGHAAWIASVPAGGTTTARAEDVLGTGGQLTGGLAVQRSQYLFMRLDLDWAAPEGGTFALRERRRIRFGERHYYDHAAFGVVALVSPQRTAG